MPEQLDPNDPAVQALLSRLDQYETGVSGIRQHLAAAGINVPPVAPPSPSPNPLVSLRDASISETDAPVSSPVSSLSVAPAPQTRWENMPPPPPEPEPEREVLPLDRWNEIMFRPGMAAAMLYVILPVIQDALRAKTAEEASAAIDQMDIWMKLTLPMQDALSGIFQWMEMQLESHPSVIPDALLANMQRATEAYDAGLPQAPGV